MFGFGDSVEIKLTADITRDQLFNYPVFRSWLEPLRANLELQQTDQNYASDGYSYTLRPITIESVD